MLCFRTYGGFAAGQYDGGDPYIEGTKMKKIDFEFIKKADFVLVFILAVLGIILLCVTILQEIIPYHGSRQNNRIAVVDDEKIEIKEYIEFDRKIRDAYIFKEDTNNDKILDGKDDIALYISDYDGKNLNEISASIDTFAFIDKNQFLFTEYNGTDSTYYAYDCAERKKYMIKSGVKEKSAGKLIVLY